MTREDQANEAYHFLKSTIREHATLMYAPACERALEMIYQTKAPAARSHHHNYEYGLLLHVAEVYQYMVHLDSATLMSQSRFSQQVWRSVNHGTLLVLALFHDLAKVKEYQTVNGEIVVTPYYSNIGHIVGSLQMLQEFLLGVPVPEDIAHALLAHHGRKEWGSPVEPQTQLAWTLHLADMMSSKAGPTK